MSLASVFAKTIVKASDNVFDAQKVNAQIKGPVATINEAVPFTSNDQVEYAQKVVRSLITGESPKFSNKEKGLDPDGAIYNSLDEMLVGQLPELRYARYYKVADKEVELEEADQAVVEYYRDIISAKKEARLLSETAIQTAAENVVKNIKALPEYKRFVTARMPKKVDAEDDPITSITNRDVAEKEFLRDSLETDYVYRATDLGADREYDLRFPFPAEISTHVGGDMGQANFIAIQKIFGDDARDIVLADAKFVTGADADGFPIKKRVVPEKSLNKFFAMRQAFTRMGWSPTELDLDKETFDGIARTLQLNEVEEMAMLRSATSFNNVVLNKGRVNIQNPLDLKDQGWTPDEFNADPELWIKAIANQTGFTEKELLRDPAYLDLKSEIKGSSNYVQGLINGNTINFLTDSLEGLRSAQLSLKIKDWLESYGFDSIRYINSFEPSVPEGSGYSYVLFQPEQFKSATAVRFDPTDPRFTAAEGGAIGFLKKFLGSNQEIQETARRTVRKGDTLAKISKDTGVSVEELQRFNNLKDPNKIQAGQSLRVREPIEKNQVMSNLVSYLNPFTGDKTAEDYDSKVVDELRKAAKNAVRAGRMNIEYEDYRGANVRRQASSPEQRTKDSFIRRMALGQTNPTEEAAFSVGGSQILIEDGNVYATDVYDFSEIPREKIKDTYSAMRYAAGKFPGNEFKSKIYLGTADEFGVRQERAKGGKVDKNKMKCNSPKRTPSHPKKSHVVKACKDGKEKIIRFGEQGAKTAGKPKAGESKRMKAKRKSFKARHGRNIKKGNMSAAYWANKVKW